MLPHQGDIHSVIHDYGHSHRPADSNQLCMYVCMYVYMYVYMYVCTYVCMYLVLMCL
jgi:hypothetical protein